MFEQAAFEVRLELTSHEERQSAPLGGEPGEEGGG